MVVVCVDFEYFWIAFSGIDCLRFNKRELTLSLLLQSKCPKKRDPVIVLSGAMLVSNNTIKLLRINLRRTVDRFSYGLAKHVFE